VVIALDLNSRNAVLNLQLPGWSLGIRCDQLPSWRFRGQVARERPKITNVHYFLGIAVDNRSAFRARCGYQLRGKQKRDLRLMMMSY
jgi:hypothetical protein